MWLRLGCKALLPLPAGGDCLPPPPTPGPQFTDAATTESEGRGEPLAVDGNWGTLLGPQLGGWLDCIIWGE